MAIKYPYTDFHEMNLDWTLETVKKAEEDSTQAKATATASLARVEQFIRDLDLQGEVDTTINEMIENGEFEALLDPVTAQAVADWLSANITPTTPIVDDTLTIQGAAADAEETGNRIAACFQYRGTLTSSDDLNAITDPGIYYCDSALGYPDNVPAQIPGRIIVFKSNSSSYASNCQIYVANVNNNMRMFYRISKANTATIAAWNDVEWVQVATIENLQAIDRLNYHRFSLPLFVGTMNTYGRFSNAGNRVRPLMTYTGLSDIKLTGYKVKFYYYSSFYCYDWHTAGTNPSQFMYTTAWQNIDDYVSPEPDKYVICMFAKQDDTNFTDDEVAYIRENLEVYTKNEYPVLQQNRSLPYNATLYHAEWDSLLSGSEVTRTLLGNVNNDSDYPIYAYEIHTQRNWVNQGYSTQTYNGSNALYTRKKIFILAGLHGNEKCTPMDVLTVAKELISGSMMDIGAMFDWYIIPLGNPWGYSHARLDSNGNILYGNTGTTASIVDCDWTYNAGIRYNETGMDINRDFSDNTYVGSDGNTYGWQTPEAQIMKSYMLSEKWDLFFDCHQNHEDRDSGMNRVISYIGIKWSSDDSPEMDDLKYEIIDQAAKAVNADLYEYYHKQAASRQATMVWQRTPADDTAGGNSHSGTACTYFGGGQIDNTGNTANQSIAAFTSTAIETSECCFTYCHLADKWYNPIANTCSTTILRNVLRAYAKGYNLLYWMNWS